MTTLPSSVPVLVVGAGVHGLSTAWHLARKGERVLVLDKAGVAAGASGIACGVVRNNYFQPAMSELMAACVDIWESDPEALHYHGSGYVALGPSAQEPDLVEVHERHRRIGYDSELITGEAEVEAHMRALYPDWRAEGLTVCLHEHRGGYAFNKESMLGLADKARAAGAEIAEGVEVTGFERDGAGAVTVVKTSAGAVADAGHDVAFGTPLFLRNTVEEAGFRWVRAGVENDDPEMAPVRARWRELRGAEQVRFIHARIFGDI